MIFLKNLIRWAGQKVVVPAFVLFSRAALPATAFLYKILRLADLALRDFAAFFRGQAMRLLTGRHAVQIAAVAMALLVTTTNIKAGEMTAMSVDDSNERSVLEVIFDPGYYDDSADLISEENLGEPASPSVGYMDGLVIQAGDALTEEDPATDVLAGEEGAEYERPQPFADAAHPLPDAAGLGSGNHPSTRTRIVQYTVEDGDTIGIIAEKFGLKTATILAVNGLTARSIIRPGAVLRVPPMDGIVYVTKRGDTLAAIAKRLSAEPEKIVEANALANADSLGVGTELIVPGGKLPAPPPAPARKSSSAVASVSSPTPSSGAKAGRLLWPAGCRRISQYYRGAAHTGLDIACPLGTSLYAAEDGVVAYAGWNTGGYGYMTIINHGGGLYTRYAHQKTGGVLVKVGESVTRGQVIGLMGSTGRSTGSHLHFEVMIGSYSSRRNPLDYIR